MSIKRNNWLLFVFVFVMLGFSYFIYKYDWIPVDDASQATAYLATNTQTASSQKLPDRMIIPAIRANAHVEHLGIMADGTVGVPKGPEDVSWFSLGTRPGDIGSSVIVGHYGWANGVVGVFDNLRDLEKGDMIYIVDEAGATTTFMVSELKLYDEHDNATPVFRSSDGKSHLNLITCEGVWDKVRRTYSGRLVVFSDKVL